MRCVRGWPRQTTTPVPAPDVTASVELGEFRVVALEALVLMKLTSFRGKDRMHQRDMIDVELIEESWPM